MPQPSTTDPSATCRLHRGAVIPRAARSRHHRRPRRPRTPPRRPLNRRPPRLAPAARPRRSRKHRAVADTAFTTRRRRRRRNPNRRSFQSRAQARARWGDTATDAMWAASTIKIHPRRARQNLRPRGNLPLNRRLRRRTVHNNTRRPPTRSSSTVRKTPALSPQALRRLGPGEAVMLPRNAPPVRTLLRPTLVAARGTADT